VIAAWALADAFFGTRRRFRALRGRALLAYQDERARAIVAYAAAKAPMYARHYRGRDLWDWRALPTIDKQLMMDNFGEINTRDVPLDEAFRVALQAEHTGDFRPAVRGLTVGLSSGTSGHRSLFLADRAEQGRWVGVVLARLLPPFRLRGYTVALFSMSGSNLYDGLRGRWLRFHHHNLATPLDAAVRALNGEQPDLLCGPPSYLDALSELQAAGELTIAPRAVVSVAEMLEPYVAAGLAERFGCPVREIYQCTEGLVAISCNRSRLHVQEDAVAVQFEPMAAESLPGEPTMPVITDLWHRTLPVIRYRLRDIVTLAAEHCPCGSAFQVIDRVEGRSDDVCEFRRHDGTVRRVFPATIRRMVALAPEVIADYEVEQRRPSHLRVRVALRPGADAASVIADVRARIVAGLEEQEITGADLEVECGACHPRAGKRRRVRCLASDPTAAEV
jgi:phenylacetate-CoA ligase